MVEGEEDVVLVPKHRRELHLELIVEIWRLVVVGDGSVGLRGKLWRRGLAEDDWEGSVFLLPGHELDFDGYVACRAYGRGRVEEEKPLFVSFYST